MEKKMKWIPALALALLLTAPVYAGFSEGGKAGFSGPGSDNGVTVQAAKNMRDDAHVTLTGSIVKRLGDEKYLFRDATGEITVEIDDDDFRGQHVTPQNTIRIIGEVDKEFGRATEIDVDRLEVLN